LQGDILTVTYTDKYDASGKEQTVTDSATFDLRNGFEIDSVASVKDSTLQITHFPCYS
jgi:hypothetical protein